MELLPKEDRFDDLEGIVGLKLITGENFNSLCSRLAGYNPERFDAVALRVFSENSPIVTIYAQDLAQSQKEQYKGKVPVHKFKLELKPDEFFSFLKQINFTLTDGRHDLSQMVVLNK